MFEESFDTVVFEDGTTIVTPHDNETEQYYFNGGETFTEQEYAEAEAASARADMYEEQQYDQSWF